MKTVQLTSGVTLNIIPTEKYKTIRIMIRFATLVEPIKNTKRMLLSNMLETNSLHYPTQTKLNEKLADLYGANFGVGITKRGNLHWVTAELSVVNEKYLAQGSGVLEEAVVFLKEILFYPNFKDNFFDERTFELEKSNIRDYIKSIEEDKQSYASLAVHELYFANSPEQKVPSFGSVELLEPITKEELTDYYHEMMAHDQVMINVIGDVNEEQIQNLFEKWTFTPREKDSGDIFYRRPLQNIIQERVERQPIIQSKLNIAYQTDVYFQDHDYFALQVFNGIFGGFPHSKLFMNVREKESMAYYASSSADSFRGMLTVQSGIEAKNREKALSLIEQQLTSIVAGDITDEEMLQTKEMLRNQYLLLFDNPSSTLEKEYISNLLPDLSLTLEEWMARLEIVSKQDVQKIAKRIKKQAIFFLEGEGN